MSGTEITREGVLRAIAEYDELGRDAFLKQYGFSEAREYYLLHDGRSYDSKAIAAVAHKWPNQGVGRPLASTELNGGRRHAAKWLEDLGFTVSAPLQNEDWSWDEHVLALDLYMTNPASPPNKQSQSVLALSELLQRMGEDSGAAMTDKFRNANGVYMKMMNFRRFDPAFQAQGKTGLPGGSRGEEAVWQRFADDLDGLREAAVAIKARYPQPPSQNRVSVADPVPHFPKAFGRFKSLVAANQKGQPFTNFAEGVVAAQEGYKPRLRQRAFEHLSAGAWTEASIGSGDILEHTITAIEIQEDRLALMNNLVFWQNRYGHANRDHRAFLDARNNPKALAALEQALFNLFHRDDEGTTFEHLASLTGGKYPLLAYLFFLKDSDRFLPIQPTTFDQAFHELGIDLTTLRSCTWENYTQYNGAIAHVRDKLAASLDQQSVRLIDAHSFCWLLIKLPAADSGKTGGSDLGRILSARAKAIINMRLSIEQTVRNANGQQVSRTLKNKDLLLASQELEKLLERLMETQENRCALTGIAFDFDGDDLNLRPSPDRIDSQGHYEDGNIQIVCRFINFWKSSTENEEFKRLLHLVRQDLH